jgi:hypothetical protein
MEHGVAKQQIIRFRAYFGAAGPAFVVVLVPRPRKISNPEDEDEHEKDQDSPCALSLKPCAVSLIPFL